MMSGFMEKYEGQRFSSKLRMKGKAAIDCDGALVLKPERLRIDYSEIELEVECQVWKRIAEVAQQHVQQVLAIAPVRLQNFQFR
jgi:hypothetical protein